MLQKLNKNNLITLVAIDEAHCISQWGESFRACYRKLNCAKEWLPNVPVIALTIYALLVLSIFKFIPITLTLSGIAGFILSIGMAVDANVLIFERIKEEIRKGKPVIIAINEGFSRAWNSIFDSNVSTIITCVILAYFGTSIIEGFAITLGIGVVLSMFSAMFITKTLLKVLAMTKLRKNLWLFGVKK